MPERISEFWKLRSSGRLHEARLLLTELEKTPSLEPADQADLALMRISFLRVDQGGLEAEKQLERLESQISFSPRHQFQLAYQKACNSLVQGHFSLALEHVLKAGPQQDPWNRLMALTTRLICLDNLGFDLSEVQNEVERELKQCSIPELKAAALPSFLGVKARACFRRGDWKELFSLAAPAPWSQVTYFQSWVASLPAFDFSKAKLNSASLINPASLLQNSLRHLTSDADFYLRNYRLQTLVGRAYVAPQKTLSSWGDRADRLYLWTWRWLLDPSPSHAEALSMILAEFDDWNGQDVLTALDTELVRLSLEWLLLFEPRGRTRWSALLRRVNTPSSPRSPLFHLEDLWLKKAQTLMGRDSGHLKELESQISLHPLSSDPCLQYHRIQQELPLAHRSSLAQLIIDVESGRLEGPKGQKLRSLPLARLFELLHRQSRCSFAEALLICFEIPGYEPHLHDAKVQNLVVRARALIGSRQGLKTKDRWIFWEPTESIPLCFQTHRRPLPWSKSRSPQDKNERLRNERSLSLLLKKAAQLEGQWLGRVELEKALELPKSTLNRYLLEWIRRKWLIKKGRGRAIRYQVSFWQT